MRILACPFLRPVLSNKNCSRPLKFITETLLKEVTSKSISFYKELCSPSAICTYKGGKIRSRYTRILILILKIWEFPRLRVGFSKNLRISEVEGWVFKKVSGLLRLRFGTKVPICWDLTPKILKTWGKSEGRIFEVFREFLEKLIKCILKIAKKFEVFQGSLKISVWG